MSTVGKLLIETITTPTRPSATARSATWSPASSLAEKLRACEELEQFRRTRENLYERVRASLFLHALYRYEIQDAAEIRGTGLIPFDGFHGPDGAPLRAGDRRVPRGDAPRRAQRRDLPAPWPRPTSRSPSRPWPTRCGDRSGAARATAGCSGSAASTSTRSASIPGSSTRESDDALFPILVERTPVRLDLSHSGWSDIFFLGMDFPEGARVLNISVDLGVHGRDDRPCPPIESRLRVIPEPILRLTSIDLKACKDVDSLEELFNFGNDYLGLVKAGVVASGLIPPSLEGTHGAARRPARRGSSGRVTGWRSSARSTTSPRGRGWRSRRTCWPR